MVLKNPSFRGVLLDPLVLAVGVMEDKFLDFASLEGDFEPDLMGFAPVDTTGATIAMHFVFKLSCGHGTSKGKLKELV